MSVWTTASVPRGPLLTAEALVNAADWYRRWPGDDPPEVIVPVHGAGSGGEGLVISTARSYAFIIGCLFMALLG